MFQPTSLGGIVVLLLDLWAVVSILGARAPAGTKALWILIVLVLPLIGFILWVIAGPKAR